MTHLIDIIGDDDPTRLAVAVLHLVTAALTLATHVIKQRQSPQHDRHDPTRHHEEGHR